MADRHIKTAAGVAKRYNVSPAAVAKWKLRGFPKKTKKGYVLSACDAWVKEFRRPRDKTQTIATLDREKKEQVVRQLKRDNEVAEGKLIDRETVERETLAMCARAKNVLLRIPVTIGSKLGNDAEQMSRAIVQEALRELEEKPT